MKIITLIDFPKCCDTPCVCGHQGYLAFWKDDNLQTSQHNYDVLVEAAMSLDDEIFELLVAEVTARRLKRKLSAPANNPYNQMTSLKQKSEEKSR